MSTGVLKADGTEMSEAELARLSEEIDEEFARSDRRMRFWSIALGVLGTIGLMHAVYAFATSERADPSMAVGWSSSWVLMLLVIGLVYPTLSAVMLLFWKPMPHPGWEMPDSELTTAELIERRDEERRWNEDPQTTTHPIRRLSTWRNAGFFTIFFVVPMLLHASVEANRQRVVPYSTSVPIPSTVDVPEALRGEVGR